MFVGNGPDLDDSDEKSDKYHLTGETYAIVYIGYFVLVIAMANLLIAVRHALL